MKQAKRKQRKTQQVLRPRSLLATHPLLKKAAHICARINAPAAHDSKHSNAH